MEGETAGPDTLELLRRWHAGDRRALDAIVRRELPWIERKVRARLGARLRAKEETGDIVQEALLEFLEYGPRFLATGRGQVRALLARIAENVLRGRHDWFAARRRAMSRERPLPADGVLSLDGSLLGTSSPSRQAADAESQAVVRLALELLHPSDREVILLREWEGLSHAEVGRRLGASEAAARMRYARALARLAEWIARVRRGEIEEAPEGEEHDERRPV